MLANGMTFSPTGLLPLLPLAFGLVILFRYRARRKGVLLFDPLVIDGDTIFSNGIKYRVHGIDAPELGQVGGQHSKDRLKLLVRGKSVKVVKTDIDKYGRVVAKLFVGDTDVGMKMVEGGFARSAFHNDYKDLERRAKRKRKGLWNQSEGISDPAAFRKMKARGGRS